MVQLVKWLGDSFGALMLCSYLHSLGVAKFLQQDYHILTSKYHTSTIVITSMATILAIAVPEMVPLCTCQMTVLSSSDPLMGKGMARICP